MPTYATISTSVTGHGSDAAMNVALRATPVVPNHLLEYPTEPVRISIGRVKATADTDGVIRLRIPLNTNPGAPWWKFELQLSPTRTLPVGSFQVTGSTTLAALMNPEMGPVEPGIVYPGADLYPSASLYPIGA